MPKLPSGVSGAQAVKALERAGFHFVRRSGGNHIYMRRDEPFAQVAVPDHRILDKGMLRTIIRDAGLTVDEFVDLLQ